MIIHNQLCFRHFLNVLKSSIPTLGILLISSCSSIKQIAVEKDISQLLNKSETFASQFTGFSLYDIEEGKFIAEYNADLKFTPASNTKLLTMYAVLRTFSDSIPSILYQAHESSIYIEPLGDPSFLYHPFKNQPIYNFLTQYDSILITLPKEEILPFGSGWAWDDYSYEFQPERSWWPIYGNALTILRDTDSTVSGSPSFFNDYIDLFDSESRATPKRDLSYNRFTVNGNMDSSRLESTVPFKYSDELLTTLLGDTLNRPVVLSKQEMVYSDTAFSMSTDHVLAYMMKPSDNFLAEQLLILSARKNKFYNSRQFIETFKKRELRDLSDIVWVDGSGLSRYNLISPRDYVVLLRKCHDEFGWERMTAILPKGGEGTLKNLYLPNEEHEEKPFIFAKTGTLSNNHNLSGYLISKSGKRLIFSMMNNHYTKPTAAIKKAMEQFLIDIREAY
ncbi:MAG: D-alanyl-D-alanine carboxypeptidase [Ekhidna sp.]|nr:D-alanyl-D-alanine carboxypeptidase [Ekhidna sp.]